jgi:predicted nuclease of predicted toxin-antitoxin system
MIALPGSVRIQRARLRRVEQGTVIALDRELAVNATVWGVELKLPLADSIIYATTHKYDAVVWTQDADFEGLENVKFYPKVKAT